MRCAFKMASLFVKRSSLGNPFNFSYHEVYANSYQLTCKRCGLGEKLFVVFCFVQILSDFDLVFSTFLPSRLYFEEKYWNCCFAALYIVWFWSILIMTAAIKGLNSLEEWTSEWDALSGEIKTFKVRLSYVCLVEFLFGFFKSSCDLKYVGWIVV